MLADNKWRIILQLNIKMQLYFVAFKLTILDPNIVLLSINYRDLNMIYSIDLNKEYNGYHEYVSLFSNGYRNHYLKCFGICLASVK